MSAKQFSNFRLTVCGVGLLLAIAITYSYHHNYFASGSLISSIGSIGSYQHKYDRDFSRNYFLTDSQCTAEFPELYKQIDISVNFYNERGGLSQNEFEEAAMDPGVTRIVIYDNQVYVKALHQGYQTKVFAVLSDIHRAVITSLEPLPNVEFIFDTADSGITSCGFSFSRRKADHHIWLMPCFSFWSWPETGVGDYYDAERKIDAVERQIAWDMKVPKLFWRGAPAMNFRREQIISRTANASWGDVKALDWSNPEERRDIWDHCRYKYLVHVEGGAYSGRLKYIQHCESVVVMHEQEFVDPYTHLIKSSGPDQNSVVVEETWNGLEEAMENLIQDNTKAQQIAQRSRQYFGQQYMTLSAEVCYWRRVIRGYASVQKFEPNLDSAVPIESVMLMRGTQWILG